MYTKRHPDLYKVTTRCIGGKVESVINSNIAKLDDVSKLEKGMMIEIPNSDHQNQHTFGIDWNLPTFQFTITSIDYIDNTVQLDKTIPTQIWFGWRYIPINCDVASMNIYALENRQMLVKHCLLDAVAISKLADAGNYNWLNNIVKCVKPDTMVDTMDEDYMTIEI
jgi:hypothetical protein